jgi:hypothetical protein
MLASEPNLLGPRFGHAAISEGIISVADHFGNDSEIFSIANSIVLWLWPHPRPPLTPLTPSLSIVPHENLTISAFMANRMFKSSLQNATM